LLIPLRDTVELASETDGVPVVALVTSDVPKNDENASVTGSCGFSLIVDFTATVGSDFKFTGDWGASNALIGAVTAGEVLGSATVAALGLEDDGDKSETFVDDEMVRVDFGTAKKGVFVVASFFSVGGGIFGGEGKEMADEVFDDDGGSCPTDLLPLTILPSDKRYSSTPAFVIGFKATF